MGARASSLRYADRFTAHRSGLAAGGRRAASLLAECFAGIAAAGALRRADAEIVLIDRRSHRIFQPPLYQVAIAVLAPAEAVRQILLDDNALRTSLCSYRRIGRTNHVRCGACVIPHRRRIDMDLRVLSTQSLQAKKASTGVYSPALAGGRFASDGDELSPP
jgi:hypothetical protein